MSSSPQMGRLKSSNSEKAKSNKIRKRNGSSSSSSSLARKYRFKRAILMGKRGGSTTPAPPWETAATPLPARDSSASASVSARKLAATLWEINQVPKSHQKMQGRENGEHRSMSAISQKLQLADDYSFGGFDTLTNLEDRSLPTKLEKKRFHGSNPGLKDVINGVAASKELVKLLRRVRGLEERCPLSSSLFSALRFELDRALLHAHRLADETAAHRRHERERIHSALSAMAGELKAEKRLRQQAERLNKRLARELAETKASLARAAEELERESRAKEILEQVCDELARGIGEDKAQVEEMKRESEKVRAEVEKERQMLQLADVLREERVQMKLSEAKYQFEEKNAAVEELRTELDAYLKTRTGGPENRQFDKIKELEAYLKEINFGAATQEEKLGNGDGDGDDSGDSDLHSIELNIVNNGDKSYKWSYGGSEEDPKRASVSEKIQWGNICFNRSSNGVDLEFGDEPNSSEDRAKECCGETVQSQRYRSVKDLADQILSGSEIALIPGFASPTRQLRG